MSTPSSSACRTASSRSTPGACTRKPTASVAGRGRYDIPSSTVPRSAARPGSGATRRAVLVLRGRPRRVLRGAQGRAAAPAARRPSGRGSPASGATRPRHPQDLPVVQLDTAFAGRTGSSSSGTPWPGEPAPRSGTSPGVRRALQRPPGRGFVSIGCEPCTRASSPAKTNGMAGGGGSRPTRRSAACTT